MNELESSILKANKALIKAFNIKKNFDICAGQIIKTSLSDNLYKYIDLYRGFSGRFADIKRFYKGSCMVYSVSPCIEKIQFIHTDQAFHRGWIGRICQNFNSNLDIIDFAFLAAMAHDPKTIEDFNTFLTPLKYNTPEIKLTKLNNINLDSLNLIKF